MANLLDLLFAAPVLPGTILLGICLTYWLLLIAGAVDLNLLDFDLDADVDASPDAGGMSWGMTALKFFNVNDVPLMIWLSLFAGSYVVAAMLLVNSRETADDYGAIAALIAGSGAIALVATKLLTQPLRGKFDSVEPNVAATLIGRYCVVTTSEVSETFGQGRVESAGAPLLLNIRGPAGTLTKNDTAVIADYDPVRNVFVVAPVPASPQEPPQREAV